MTQPLRHCLYINHLYQLCHTIQLEDYGYVWKIYYLYLHTLYSIRNAIGIKSGQVHHTTKKLIGLFESKLKKHMYKLYITINRLRARRSLKNYTLRQERHYPINCWDLTLGEKRNERMTIKISFCEIEDFAPLVQNPLKR